jgi:hypothetical protein
MDRPLEIGNFSTFEGYNKGKNFVSIDYKPKKLKITIPPISIDCTMVEPLVSKMRMYINKIYMYRCIHLWLINQNNKEHTISLSSKVLACLLLSSPLSIS